MQPFDGQVTPIILAGGAGTRLWPMSRTAWPKQFLKLLDDHSLFEETLLRISSDPRYSAPIVVTNADYRFVAAEQAHEIGVDLAAIILEPMARNTAPAITTAVLAAGKGRESAIVHVLPSDHRIRTDKAYSDAVDVAVAAARRGKLVTFGITPTEPVPGFGYIEAGEWDETGAQVVSRFVEKPDMTQASHMIEKGGYYWNSGMFVFDTDVYLAECDELAPDVARAARAAFEGATSDLNFLRLDREAFASAPNISIDYALLEKTSRAAVVVANIEWSDLGSWDAVWTAGQRDSHGNVSRGPVTLSNVSNALVITEKHHVVVDGLKDIAVLASEDAVYVGRLSSAQSVGAIVKRLETDSETRHLTEFHKTSYRPWGGYTSVVSGERFQVKRLFVKPGQQLSLQKHFHRSEHWVVVKGTAEVQVEDEIRTLRENESVYIPQGAVHRLINPGKILLELIEVQTGSYLGEDDIVRIEDQFGRM